MEITYDYNKGTTTQRTQGLLDNRENKALTLIQYKMPSIFHYPSSLTTHTLGLLWIIVNLSLKYNPSFNIGPQDGGSKHHQIFFFGPPTTPFAWVWVKPLFKGFDFNSCNVKKSCLFNVPQSFLWWRDGKVVPLEVCLHVSSIQTHVPFDLTSLFNRCKHTYVNKPYSS